MVNRRNFIKKSSLALMAGMIMPRILQGQNQAHLYMSVTGPIKGSALQFTLTHEHVLADFIGAKGYSKSRYDAEEVFNIALPFLKEVKKLGCATFFDCSPMYLGRDVLLLKRLAEASGLNIITNTGYYGAVGEKFLPPNAYTETAEQIASRWVSEWKNGIEGTGIKPGFIKTSVDEGPLTSTQRKIVDAAALTHLETGLPIAIHTGNGAAAKEQLEILAARGVSPSARIWVHALNEKSIAEHIEAAKKGSWISYDGVNPESFEENLKYVKNMKKEGFLSSILVSQDSGWYNVGEPRGGNYKNYNFIFKAFIPALKEEGFTQKEVDTIFITNPAKAFAIHVRNLKK